MSKNYMGRKPTPGKRSGNNSYRQLNINFAANIVDNRDQN